MSVTGICLYSKDNDNFLCFKQTGGDTYPERAETKIEKAIEYKNCIEIYDRYLWEVYGVDENTKSQYMYYKSRFNETELITTRKVEESHNEEEAKENNRTSDDIFKQGALYKHTFKKDKNGNYYWYSSDRVKEK